MKNISIKSIACFFASLMLFGSCSQYEDTTEQNDLLMKSSNFKDRHLTNEEIHQLGVDHNHYLSILLNDANDLNDVKTNFNSIMSTESKTVSESNYDAYVNSTVGLTTDNLVDFITLNKDYFNDYATLTVKMTELNNANTNAEMLAVENDAKNMLGGIDLDMFLVNSSVSRASLNFWNDFKPNAPMQAKSDWMRADGLAAAIGFFVLACVVSAIALCAGTGGLAMPAVACVAEVAGIGLGAAISSAVVYFELI